MAEGYYYTLSAIAQSFAAIVALNAVFVIYKFQLLRNQGNELILTLRQLPRHNTKKWGQRPFFIVGVSRNGVYNKKVRYISYLFYDIILKRNVARVADVAYGVHQDFV